MIRQLRTQRDNQQWMLDLALNMRGRVQNFEIDAADQARAALFLKARREEKGARGSMNHFVRWTMLVCCAAAAHFAPIAFAQKYPTKTVRLVVPFTPGGGTDIMARLVAQNMSDVLGQAVVVDNRGGGGGKIGAEIGVRAAPDGYTLLLLASSYASNAVLYKLPYDPIKDLQPIVQLGETGFLIVVNPSVPVKTTKELIDFAKARPGTLNYASSGTGSSPHLAFELLKSMTGIDVVHVPYKGSGPNGTYIRPSV